MESPARTRDITALDETWGRVDGYLRSRLRPDLYDRWFAPLRASAIDDGRLHVAAPDKFHRDFVDDNYRPWFEEFLPAVTGTSLRVVFVVDDRRGPPPRTRRPGPTRAPSRPSPTSSERRPGARYTFETFVVGESNRFAFAAAQAVAQKPGPRLEPALPPRRLRPRQDPPAPRHRQRHPGLQPGRPRRRGHLRALHQRLRRRPAQGDARRVPPPYRECAALLIDDVQFFAGKDKTAEEFFHTFNTLYEQGVQIVLSSDRSPKELKGLEERLCSRFEWGMRVQIDVARVRDPRRHPEEEGGAGADRPARRGGHAAGHPHPLQRPRAARRAQAKLGLRLAQVRSPSAPGWPATSLSDVIPPPGYKPTIERIQEATAAHYGLTVAKLTSSSRGAEDRHPAPGRHVPLPRAGQGDLPAHRREVQRRTTPPSSRPRSGSRSCSGRTRRSRPRIATLTQKLGP